MKKLIVIVVALLIMTSCAKKGEYVRYRAIDDYQVQKLFEANGASIYRFYDGGRHHYFTINGSSINVEQSTGGKNAQHWNDSAPTRVKP